MDKVEISFEDVSTYRPRSAPGTPLSTHVQLISECLRVKSGHQQESGRPMSARSTDIPAVKQSTRQTDAVSTKIFLRAGSGTYPTNMPSILAAGLCEMLEKDVYAKR